MRTAFAFFLVVSLFLPTGTYAGSITSENKGTLSVSMLAELERHIADIAKQIAAIRTLLEEREVEPDWGIYADNRRESLTQIETLLGEKPKYYAIFWGFDDVFPTDFHTLGSGETLVVFWEPDDNLDSIINGSRDTYLRAFAKGAQAYATHHPLIIVPFNEMNLTYPPWGDSGSNTPEKFVRAWRHIHDIFTATRATPVLFGIAYNVLSAGPHPEFKNYYPGDRYVDYVGVDGFNWGSSGETPEAIFDQAITEASTFNKPLFIFSTGAAASIHKPKWIDSFRSYVRTIPHLRGWIWFHADKERDWRIHSDPASLAAFKRLLGD